MHCSDLRRLNKLYEAKLVSTSSGTIIKGVDRYRHDLAGKMGEDRWFLLLLNIHTVYRYLGRTKLVVELDSLAASSIGVVLRYLTTRSH